MATDPNSQTPAPAAQSDEFAMYKESKARAEMAEFEEYKRQKAAKEASTAKAAADKKAAEDKAAEEAKTGNYDFTDNPEFWSKPKQRSYQQKIHDAYSEAAVNGDAAFPCVATGSIQTQRACKCSGCVGAVAAHEKQMELTGYVPETTGAARPGIINLSDPRLAKDPQVQELLAALLSKLK